MDPNPDTIEAALGAAMGDRKAWSALPHVIVVHERRCICGEQFDRLELAVDHIDRLRIEHMLKTAGPVIAASVEAATREAIADAIGAARPHIPPTHDPKRREYLIQRVSLNLAARIVRSAVPEGSDK